LVIVRAALADDLVDGIPVLARSLVTIAPWVLPIFGPAGDLRSVPLLA
jgi:hypothetical protein